MLKSRSGLALLLLPWTSAGAAVLSNHDLGKAEGACRKDEPGPALLVDVAGLKDRKGTLKLEVYPDDEQDFLQDDKILIREGKTFRRVEVPVPTTNPVTLCIRVPSAGRYAVSLLHDRDSNRRFAVATDGIGFASNPKIHWSKPLASDSSATAGPGLTHIRIVLNYWHGMFAFGPVARR